MSKSVTGYLKHAFHDPYWFFGVILRRVFSKIIKSDELFIKLEYFSGMKRFPNLNSPKTYNEKLQWLKLHCKDEKYTLLVDKYESKLLVKNLVGGGDI